DHGLEELSAMLPRTGELTYEAISMSIDECFYDKEVYTKVHEMSDMLVSMAEYVEDKVFELISRFQPVASDLRTIKSYMKIAYDFARYGRYAFDISYINSQLNGLRECEVWIKQYIKEMSEKVLKMVRISIDSLRNYDIELAKTVSQIEKEVDKMYFGFFDKLTEKEPSTNKCVISSVLTIRYLERIADHATYICEAVVYIATGQKVVLR
ncbi:MAG: phosphate signaling complex protein PhoU, partial [Candidatus Bathyarchaeia archaeon]